MEHAIDYFKKYIEGLQSVEMNRINQIIGVIFNAWKHDNRVFIVGNGGSASTASHMACDLGKGTLDNHYDSGNRRLRVSSLTDNVAHMTALGNDLSYEEIFSQQLRNAAKPGDVLIVITASGNSPNILRAVEVGNDIGMVTIGLLGFGGGKAKEIVDHNIIYPEKHYGRVEDFHLMLNHIITEKLSKMIRGEK